MRKRGEIWLADLNPRRGTEPGKTRPVLIVQAQALLDAEHPSTLVVPLTTQLVDAAEPLRERGLKREGFAERVEREERQQAARQRHEGPDPARVGAAQRGQLFAGVLATCAAGIARWAWSSSSIISSPT